ncbi:MAG TPA: hypothetical protein VKA27_15540, partial [Sunxiuqinia sp.]|nr:hypothetical protein [Sunxiuqinia sp.]
MENLGKYRFLIVSILLFVLAFFLENRLLHHHPEIKLIHHFESELHEQKDLLNKKLDAMEKIITSDQFNGNFDGDLHEFTKLYHEKGLGFVILSQNKMVYWSHNHFAFTSRFLSTMKKQELLPLPNGTYFGLNRQIDTLNLIGLIQIKDIYSIENQYISNHFVRPFKLPDSFVIQKEHSNYNIPVHDENGEYLFSILPNGNIRCNYSQLYLPALIYFLAFIFLMFFAREQFKLYRHEHFIVRNIVLGFSLFGIYWLHILFRIPQLLYAFQLFQPALYAYSFWLPSLGDLLLVSILIFFWVINFTKDFAYSKQNNRLEFTGAYLFSFLFYIMINVLVENLIRNSSITFQLNQIDDINQFSVVGYLIIAFLFFSAFSLNFKIVEASERFLRKSRFLRIHAGLIALFVVLALIYKNSYLYVICLFLVTNFSVFALQRTQFKRHSLSYLIYF